MPVNTPAVEEINGGMAMATKSSPVKSARKLQSGKTLEKKQALVVRMLRRIA